MGAGQFCTNPGIAIVIDGPEANAFVAAATEVLTTVAAQTMLTDGMADAYRDGARRVSERAGVKSLLTTSCEGRSAAPYLFEVWPTTGCPMGNCPKRFLAHLAW
ncbi:hypothetical protein IMCC21224_113835 [Puniceibacterium sp. IMCC21224]|nr:hypothetical protein IMCC21224_113835 [Puniceibacterium sp. IMCC21224]